MNSVAHTTFQVIKWDGSQLNHHLDDLSEESPLEIHIGGEAITVTMRTPGHDAELTAGFLLSEGIIQSARDFLVIQHCSKDRSGSTMKVALAPHVSYDRSTLKHYYLSSSSCGLCGKATIAAIDHSFEPVQSATEYSADRVMQMPQRMRMAQASFSRTGSTHAAALFSEQGELLVVREDVGRHNAVDKVLGYCVLKRQLPLSNCLLLVSGRVSFEIMQKSLAGQIPVIAAVSAPTSLAVQFAQRSQQTLIGFLRNQRMNIYTHPARIGFPNWTAPL